VGQVVRLTGSVVAEGEARVSGAYSGTPGVVAGVLQKRADGTLELVPGPKMIVAAI
jgi:hypothetical protein